MNPWHLRVCACMHTHACMCVCVCVCVCVEGKQKSYLDLCILSVIFHCEFIPTLSPCWCPWTKTKGPLLPSSPKTLTFQRSDLNPVPPKHRRNSQLSTGTYRSEGQLKAVYVLHVVLSVGPLSQLSSIVNRVIGVATYKFL